MVGAKFRQFCDSSITSDALVEYAVHFLFHCTALQSYRNILYLKQGESQMQRYVAFLRGVSPMNAKMPELKRAFEKAGFADVRTVLGSGNVVFSSEQGADAGLALLVEQAMQKHLARPFPAIVRSV